ncbi:hypothetical protein KDA14_01180 [Candidatus Saccharibacteria bacterium]|nr:hypothetical protein [Candidatus Saccharibacteria bacterium]
MPGLYVVENHISAVAEAGQSCGELVHRLGSATCGSEVLPMGWAREERVATTALQGLMRVFCTVDLGHAFPADNETRQSSLEHLAEAQAAFSGLDLEAREKAELTYATFDTSAAYFYRGYAHAFGQSVTAEGISKTNECIDGVVEAGARMLGGGTRYGLIFPNLVDSLTRGRDAMLQGVPLQR